MFDHNDQNKSKGYTVFLITRSSHYRFNPNNFNHFYICLQNKIEEINLKEDSIFSVKRNNHYHNHMLIQVNKHYDNVNIKI